MNPRILFSSTCLAAFLLIGCTPGNDPLERQAREQLQFGDAKELSLSVGEVISKLASTSGSTATEKPRGEWIINAKVGSGKGDTFDPKIASFLVSEIPEGEHKSDTTHDPDNCPFCRAREEKAPTIVVSLVDKNGVVFQRGADRLLSLKKGQHILIRAKADFDPTLNILSLEANGLKQLD